jgi:hypothetical protein
MAYMATDSQVASKVEAKPNMESAWKLRCSSELERTQAGFWGAHSDDLLQVERPHVAAVGVGAGPLWVHCEVAELRRDGVMVWRQQLYVAPTARGRERGRQEG